jgi:hypothetical protein
MALPGSKAPLPGYKLIVDSNGNYIDDVPNIRLGSEFVLSRNAADPSANISVAAYVAAQIAAAAPVNSGVLPGRVMTPVLIDEQTVTGTTYTSPTWAANLYRKLFFELSCSSGGGNITFTCGGLSGTYDSAAFYGTGATGPSYASFGATWLAGFGAGFSISGSIVSRIGSNRVIEMSYLQPSGALRASVRGSHTDTTNGITNLVATMVTGTFTVSLYGIPT